jgi:hypothetical protein
MRVAGNLIEVVPNTSGGGLLMETLFREFMILDPASLLSRNKKRETKFKTTTAINLLKLGRK